MKPTDRSYAVDRTEEEWKATLSPDEYQVLRQAGTERPYAGEYTDAKTVGTYACRACGAELFTSETKFDSHCGWPSFFSPLAGESVELLEDRSLPGRPAPRCAAPPAAATSGTSSRARATTPPPTSGSASTRSA